MKKRILSILALSILMAFAAGLSVAQLRSTSKKAGICGGRHCNTDYDCLGGMCPACVGANPLINDSGQCLTIP
jgi:hypothetical protein